MAFPFTLQQYWAYLFREWTDILIVSYCKFAHLVVILAFNSSIVLGKGLYTRDFKYFQRKKSHGFKSELLGAHSCPWRGLTASMRLPNLESRNCITSLAEWEGAPSSWTCSTPKSFSHQGTHCWPKDLCKFEHLSFDLAFKSMDQRYFHPLSGEQTP